jgi:putative acetyltransferase
MPDPLIVSATVADYPELITLWEASVRATHDFLTEADIQSYKQLISAQYFASLDLYFIRDHQQITAFIGVDDELLQMLFIHPAWRGRGVGKFFLQHAIKNLGITSVDVNEQNEQAVGFYYHMGFQPMAYFERDAAGKPYPIIAMELTNR